MSCCKSIEEGKVKSNYRENCFGRIGMIISCLFILLLGPVKLAFHLIQFSFAIMGKQQMDECYTICVSNPAFPCNGTYNTTDINDPSYPTNINDYLIGISVVCAFTTILVLIELVRAAFTDNEKRLYACCILYAINEFLVLIISTIWYFSFNSAIKQCQPNIQTIFFSQMVISLTVGSLLFGLPILFGILYLLYLWCKC